MKNIQRIFPIAAAFVLALRAAAADENATDDERRLSTEEAVRVVDEVFALDDDFKPEDVRRKMRRLLTDGFGVMTCTTEFSGRASGSDAPVRTFRYRLVHLVPELSLPVRDEWGKAPYRPELCVPVDKGGCTSDKLQNVVAWCTTDPVAWHRDVMGSVRRFEAATSRVETVSREVVADVETVRLVSLANLASGPDEDAEAEQVEECVPQATYLVTMRLRATLAGEAGFRRFSFPVVFGPQPLTREGAWLFYRGITLAVGFASSNGVERVARIDPVLPYPPYTKEGIRVYDHEGASEMEDTGEAFAGVASGDSRLDQERALCLNYGDHTFVQFTSGTNAVEGMCGSYPELGSSVRIEVWTDGAGSDPDYWRDAWFSYSGEHTDWEHSPVRVKPALACFNDYDHGAFEFSWRGIRFPSVSFRPPATMKDFADYLTVATKPMGEGRRLYQVMADASCARRAIRAYAAKDVGAFELLEKVCEMNGCDFEVKATNVTIKAALREDEMSPPDLDALFGELTAAGMASVKGADYADGWFCSPVEGDYDEEAKVLPNDGLDWPGRAGKTWLLPVEGNTNRVRFLACDCVWWEVARGENKRDYSFRASDEGPVRLKREIARLIFALEEDAKFIEPVRVLAFAVQIHSAGCRREAVRIMELLWRRPNVACAALKAFRAQVAEVRRKYPTAAMWAEEIARKKAETEAKEKEVPDANCTRGDDSDEASDETERDIEEEEKDEFYF